MEPLRGDDLAALQKELRARLRQGDGPFALSAAQAKLLLDELGRLVQSNERLRRQNRRVRRRLHDDAGAPPDPAAGTDAGADAEATP